MIGGQRSMASRRPTRGIASLGLVVLWLLAASLLALYANRALVFDQRAAANATRATTAFEAAEAGLAWGLAALNHWGPLNTQCEPASEAGPGQLRRRLLELAPRGQPLRPGLTRAGCRTEPPEPWHCSCPEQAGPLWPTSDLPSAAAFGLQVVGLDRPDAFALESTGCANVLGDCIDATTADAAAHLSIRVAAMAVLTKPPSSPLSAGGGIRLGRGAAAVNADASSGGMAAHAGGAVTLDDTASVASLPGRPAWAAVWAQDRNLQDGDLTAATVGRSLVAQRDLPGVLELHCDAGCTAADISAAWAGGDQPVVWAHGPVTLEPVAPLGSATAPLLLVVDGPLTLSDAMQGWGVFIAASIEWNHGGAGTGRMHGALVSRADIALTGQVQALFDADVLQRLAALQVFVRIPGSWNDLQK